MTGEGGIVSLFGKMRAVFLPEDLVTNTQEIGEALLAYQHHLTREEVRLLRLILAALTNEQIAEQMALAEIKSVKHRIQTLYNKLGVSRRTEAALIAAKYGLWAEKGPPDSATRP